MTATSKVSYTVTVPPRDYRGKSQKWKTGALVRDINSHTLYRVTGPSQRYHEDCDPVQPATLARKLPEDWKAIQRLLEVMDQLEKTGTRPPSYRGGEGEEIPSVPNGTQDYRWIAQRVANSYAQFPSITVRADIVFFIRPIYDDSPTVGWVRDQKLADEVRGLIETKPSLTRYPEVHVRQIGG